MIKRSVNVRFRQAVLDGIKKSTIRDNPWPEGKPIMLYHWSGKPYRSKHVDICAVVVHAVVPITIQRAEDDAMLYSYLHLSYQLWSVEGFASREDMDAWFRPLVRPGSCLKKHLMFFRRVV